MFGSIGGPEIIFVFVLALLIFGPRKLPEIGRSIGRTLSEFRKATNEFRTNLEREIEVEKVKQAGKSLDAAARDVGAALNKPDPKPHEPQSTRNASPAEDAPAAAPGPASAPAGPERGVDSSS